MFPSIQKFQQITLSRQAQFPRSNVTESPEVPGGGGGGGGDYPSPKPTLTLASHVGQNVGLGGGLGGQVRRSI